MSGDFYQKILFYEIFKFYFNEKTTISDFKKFKRSLGMLFETSSKEVLLKKKSLDKLVKWLCLQLTADSLLPSFLRILYSKGRRR